jgi:HK97 family phage major capsid protein
MRMQEKFARSSGAAFVTGNGIAKPRGLLTYTTAATADATRDWFVIQHVNTGDANGFPARSGDANPADRLVDMVHALRAPYRINARWTMNRTTAGTIRKMKDGQGNFIWQPATVAGQPETLLGYPVELDEEMPNIAAGTLPIAFGDFAQAYIIVEKPGLRLLRDPYSSKPHVLFYAYSRFGGGLQNGEAVKLLRVAASG